MTEMEKVDFSCLFVELEGTNISQVLLQAISGVTAGLSQSNPTKLLYA